ncbi:hypothetical protein [Chamaesiphon sp.]|uniref:hypothetical protein n=1 Tax=Chamaesiphon sp. TaxID=2814140 RepID=UPI0035940196
MANCPNCGSSDITLKQETNVSWGRAFVGYALFGVVGGAVGAVTGKDRTVNACLDCGSTWKAETLYQILQMIKSSTNTILDLSIEGDRIYLNQFIEDITPYIEFASRAKADAEKKCKEAIYNESEGSVQLGCMFPIIIGGGLLYTGIFFKSPLSFFISLVITISPIFIALAIEKLTKTERDKKVRKFKAVKESTIIEAENKLQWAISEFRDKHQ